LWNKKRKPVQTSSNRLAFAIVGLGMVAPVLPVFKGVELFFRATFTAFRDSLGFRIQSTAITAIRMAARFFTGIAAQSLTFCYAGLLSIQEQWKK
jgi:hypothetical protein